LSARMINSKTLESYVSFMDSDLHVLRISMDEMKWLNLNGN